MIEQNDEESLTQITYYLQLDNSGRPKLPSDQILQAERNSILHIELMNGLEITNQINLISNAQENFPYELQERLLEQNNINKKDFSRFIFQPREISTSIVYDIALERTGAIQFFFLYNEQSTNNVKSTLPFYITVLPKVFIQGKEIKLDDIQMQTILSKSLGKINEFEKYFREASKLKYNFVHFTPIQQLGISESLYCLRDNTKINNIFYDNNNISEEEKLKLMKEQLDKGRELYGIGSFVDIVLNHASDNSEWLGNHPECGYNLENTPWLNCAYSLDCILQEYSNAFCDCKTSRRCQPFVNNENDLKEIMGDLWNIVNRANLHEYFMINIEQNKKILSNFYENFYRERNKYTHEINSIQVRNDNEAMEFIFSQCLDEIGYSRNGVKLNAEKFGFCLIKLFNYNVSNREQFFGKAEYFINQCNERWKKIIIDWINGGMNNIRDGIRWEFIQNHNKAIRVKKPLIPPYFAVFDKNDKRKIFACNGWVGDSEDPNNPAPNFTEKGTYYYFKRKINIWSDCPKLNYGNSPSDCPYLIDHMTRYVQQMAKMFNGFRLDNAHSTPIFIAEYLAQKAREINPDLIIMAELFTKKEKEINFVNRIGINLLIRELIWCTNAKDLSAQIHRFGGGYDHMLGKIEANIYDYIKNDDNVILRNMKYLLPSLPHSIIFDLTHDNETYLQKMNNLALNLTKLACNSFSSTAIGSTRGFDQLFPIQPSVVNEQRRYVYDEDFNNMFHGNEHHRTVPKKENKKKKDQPKEVLMKFDFKCSFANKVDLALSCRGWKPDINLKKVGSDLFSTEITLDNNSQKILYKFVINDRDWVCDDTKPKEDDGKGNVNNVIYLGNTVNYSPSTIISDGLGLNSSQKNFHKKDLKLLRRILNSVRNDISLYKNEFYLHQENQFVCIFRTFVPEENYLENIPNCDGYALICRTGYDQGNTTPTKIELPGIYSEFVCGSTMKIGRIDVEGFKRRSDLYGTDSDVYFTKDGNWLNNFSYVNQERGRTIINFNENTPSNTAIVLKFKLTDEVRNSLINIEKGINRINIDWKNLTQNLDLCDINLVLYKCEREELDNTKGERGNYSFDNFGPLCYAGISHLHKKLNEFKLNKENNPILDNIRAGDWLLDYTIKRYKDQPNLRNIYNILCSIMDNYKKLYVHHKPVYITKIIDLIYNVMIMKLYDLMKNKDIINFSSFSRLLLNAIPQFNGYIESSRFKHNTELPYNKLSLSAGLPHFSVEYMRCWGRDTFISFNGLFLIPGLFKEAKAILLNYASVMRHGLIPNLLDSGINCRYNARDATWFFLKSVIDYVEKSKDYDIFNFGVNMVFLSDDFNEHNNKKMRGEKKIMKLAEIVHEILQRHAKGISFREWRAGNQIDEQMTDEGFNIKIYLNEENGFIYGGNKWNCGTWMDKMGSSEKARNKGHPATPRNGADCEIIGLLYYTLVHLNDLNLKGKYPFNEVQLNNEKNLRYSEWAAKIQNNFEKFFFIEKKNSNLEHDSIYKDYISDDNDIRHESQLRPNIFVTLAVAPELFNKNHAIKFMEVAEQFLIVKNCIGVRTLDYTDKNYNGNYEVHNDTDNYHLAHGLNYHNGPEWVWPSGFYLISKIKFNNEEEIFNNLCKKLISFEEYIQKDKWSGLPELTNKNGSYCEGSCPTQAWSIATIIEALDELSHQSNILEKFSNFYENKKKKEKKLKIGIDKKEEENDIKVPKKEIKKKKIIKKVKNKKSEEKQKEIIGEPKNEKKNIIEKEIKDNKGKKIKKVFKKVAKKNEVKEEPGVEKNVEQTHPSVIKKKIINKEALIEEKIQENEKEIEEKKEVKKKKIKKNPKNLEKNPKIEEKKEAISEDKIKIEGIKEKEKEDKKDKKIVNEEILKEDKKEEIIISNIKEIRELETQNKKAEKRVEEDKIEKEIKKEKISEEEKEEMLVNFEEKKEEIHIKENEISKLKEENDNIEKKINEAKEENLKIDNNEIVQIENNKKDKIKEIINVENKNVKNEFEQNEEKSNDEKNNECKINEENVEKVGKEDIKKMEMKVGKEKKSNNLVIQEEQLRSINKEIFQKESNQNENNENEIEELEDEKKTKRHKKKKKKNREENTNDTVKKEELKEEQKEEKEEINIIEGKEEIKEGEIKKKKKKKKIQKQNQEEEIVQEEEMQEEKQITISDILKSDKVQNNEEAFPKRKKKKGKKNKKEEENEIKIETGNANEQQKENLKEEGESLLTIEDKLINVNEEESQPIKKKLRKRKTKKNRNVQENEEEVKLEERKENEEEKKVEESKEDEDKKKVEESKEDEEEKKIEESKENEEEIKVEESKENEEEIKVEESKENEGEIKVEESKENEGEIKVEESKENEGAIKIEESKENEEEIKVEENKEIEEEIKFKENKENEEEIKFKENKKDEEKVENMVQISKEEIEKQNIKNEDEQKEENKEQKLVPIESQENYEQKDEDNEKEENEEKEGKENEKN